jgi:iron complex outermembrane receptor protein
LSLNPVLFDNHLKLILMEIYHLVKNRFQDEGAVIGSAIGFDPTISLRCKFSLRRILEWLEANGNLPLLPARNPVARLNQDERRSTSTRKGMLD